MEIFTARTYLCEDLVNRVKGIACEKCEVIVYDLTMHFVTDETEEKAKGFGIQSIPAIVVDGKLQDIEVLKKSKVGQLLFHNNNPGITKNA